MNILALGAHHDDIELGCGGTLAKYSSEGHKVFGVVLTNSLTEYDLRSIVRNKSSIEAESKRAAQLIGMELIDLEYPQADNGKLVYSADLMRKIEDIIDRLDIDTIFTHWIHDMNTDHRATADLTIVAARHSKTILMYRSNWYQPGPPFNGIVYSDISDHIKAKIDSLYAYEEEIRNRGSEWIDTFIQREKTNGFKLDIGYAEAFEPVQLLL